MTTQYYMTRRMMKLKRQSNSEGIFEPWLDWQKRSIRSARDAVRGLKMEIACTLRQQRLDWSGHVLRFGTGGRPEHLLKHALLWRCNDWWKVQREYDDIPGATQLVHRAKIGQIARWELSLPSNWMTQKLDYSGSGARNRGSTGNVAVTT